MKDLPKLQVLLAYQFSETEHLRCAITHKSACTHHYEKLEFLGDSILNYCISSLLFTQFTELDEGKLSIFRSKLVSKATLSNLGKSIGIDAYILTENQKVSASIRADVMEAIIGAIYKDGGMEPCKAIIHKWFMPIMKELTDKDLKDAKSHLQELTHRLSKPLPVYKVMATTGQSHNIVYTMACKIDDFITEAHAGSKRQAEMSAASKMLSLLKEQVIYE